MNTQQFQEQLEEKLAGDTHYYRWLSEAVKLWKPKTILELGTFQGGSARAMCQAKLPSTFFVTVDSQEAFLDIPDEILHNVTFNRLIVDDISEAGVQKVYETLENHSAVDFLFIDSEHSEAQVTKEWALYEPLLSDVAVVALDDINQLGKFWENIAYDKLDISKYHEGTGFGFFIYKRVSS